MHSTLLLGGRQNIAIPFGMEKLEWLPDGMYNCLDSIPVCDRGTDRHLATA